jgi:3-hydroxybutyryl-CoA dehydrogenase
MSFGRRLGVAGIFELMDLAGLDTSLSVATILAGADIDSTMDSTPILRDKVDRGELGAKSGHGFYTWTPESVAAIRERIARALIELSRLE